MSVTLPLRAPNPQTRKNDVHHCTESDQLSPSEYSAKIFSAHTVMKCVWALALSIKCLRADFGCFLNEICVIGLPVSPDGLGTTWSDYRFILAGTSSTCGTPYVPIHGASDGSFAGSSGETTTPLVGTGAAYLADASAGLVTLGFSTSNSDYEIRYCQVTGPSAACDYAYQFTSTLGLLRVRGSVLADGDWVCEQYSTCSVSVPGRLFDLMDTIKVYNSSLCDSCTNPSIPPSLTMRVTDISEGQATFNSSTVTLLSSLDSFIVCYAPFGLSLMGQVGRLTIGGPFVSTADGPISTPTMVSVVVTSVRDAVVECSVLFGNRVVGTSTTVCTTGVNSAYVPIPSAVGLVSGDTVTVQCGTGPVLVRISHQLANPSLATNTLFVGETPATVNSTIGQSILLSVSSACRDLFHPSMASPGANLAVCVCFAPFLQRPTTCFTAWDNLGFVTVTGPNATEPRTVHTSVNEAIPDIEISGVYDPTNPIPTFTSSSADCASPVAVAPDAMDTTTIRFVIHPFTQYQVFAICWGVSRPLVIIRVEPRQDCVMSDWVQTAPCSLDPEDCGDVDGVVRFERHIVTAGTGGGVDCGTLSTVRDEPCSAPPCMAITGWDVLDTGRAARVPLASPFQLRLQGVMITEHVGRLSLLPLDYACTPSVDLSTVSSSLCYASNRTLICGNTVNSLVVLDRQLLQVCYCSSIGRCVPAKLPIGVSEADAGMTKAEICLTVLLAVLVPLGLLVLLQFQIVLRRAHQLKPGVIQHPPPPAEVLATWDQQYQAIGYPEGTAHALYGVPFRVGDLSKPREAAPATFSDRVAAVASSPLSLIDTDDVPDVVEQTDIPKATLGTSAKRGRIFQIIRDLVYKR